jgi:hypothetical protein
LWRLPTATAAVHGANLQSTIPKLQKVFQSKQIVNCSQQDQLTNVEYQIHGPARHKIQNSPQVGHNLLKENLLAITSGKQKGGSHKAQCLRIAQMVCQLLQMIRSEFIILIVQNMIVSWASCSLHNITSSKLSRNQEMRRTSHNLLSHPNAQWSKNQRYKKNPHNLLSHESAGSVIEMYKDACMTAQEEVIIGRMAYVLINYCTCTNYVSVTILQFCIIRNT